LVLLVGSVSWTKDILYWRQLRPDSLTRASNTGMLSANRQLLRSDMSDLYRHCFCDYQNFVVRRISGQQLVRQIRSRVQSRRGLADTHQVEANAARLRSNLSARSRIGVPRS
jgi:hypothetical protein